LPPGAGDDDLLRAALEVRGGLFLGGEEAGALENDVDVQVLPRQLRRVALRDHADAVAVHHHVVAVDLHRPGKLAVHRVVAREVGIRLGRAEVVQRHDREVVRLAALVMRAEDVAADAAVAIDGDADGHVVRAPGR
jgi:hypothetical protein